MAKPFYPFVVTATTPTKITSSTRFHRVETNTLLDQQCTVIPSRRDEFTFELATTNLLNGLAGLSFKGRRTPIGCDNLEIHH